MANTLWEAINNITTLALVEISYILLISCDITATLLLVGRKQNLRYLLLKLG